MALCERIWYLPGQDDHSTEGGKPSVNAEQPMAGVLRLRVQKPVESVRMKAAQLARKKQRFLVYRQTAKAVSDCLFDDSAMTCPGF